MLSFLRKLFSSSRSPAPDNTPPEMKFLIVGLGNPGDKYVETRHNVGFKVLEHLSDDWGSVSHGHLAKLRHRGKQVFLLKPDTFMNLSGKAVRYWLQKENIPKEHLLVVVDDLHLEFAQLRLRGKGSDAGHNGLKSIDQLTGGNNYARLRCGIGRDFHPGGQVDYVLGEWPIDQRQGLPNLIETAGKIVLSFCAHGLQNTMSKYNNTGKKKGKKAEVEQGGADDAASKPG